MTPARRDSVMRYTHTHLTGWLIRRILSHTAEPEDASSTTASLQQLPDDGTVFILKWQHHEEKH